MNTVKFSNGISIDLSMDGGVFQGIGTVTAGNTPLRDASRLASVDIRTPDGYHFSDWQIVGSETTDKAASLQLMPSVKADGLMEWMLHEVRPRLNTTDWSLGAEPATDTSMRLTVNEINGAFGFDHAIGVRYQYAYKSGQYPIYKILDRATWEVGGQAIGNSLWIRNSFVPCLMDFTDTEQYYSTEWFQPGASNSSIFQFYPWQTALEGFSLTFHKLGALVTWTPVVSHIRTLFEKPKGANAIFHWHEHCGDLANDFSSSPMEVVWIPGELDNTGRWNLYEKVREFVAATLHDELGMVRDRVAPYGVIEEWNVPNMNHYRTHGLKKFAEVGIKTIFLPNEFENNMNVFGVSNMCCTVDYKVAETVGEDKLRKFCEAAAKTGMQVEMWGNTALSTLTHITAMKNGEQQRIDFLPTENSIYEVLKKSADPYVRNPAGAMEADHYSPVFAQLNLRDSTIHDYWMKQWTYAYKEVGIRGIFLDSSFNMTSDKFHWIENSSPSGTGGGTVDQTHLLGRTREEAKPESKILSQYRAHLDLMVEMQKVGYFYCGEDTGIFGIHRSGPAIGHRLNNIPMWSDSLATFDREEILRHGGDPAQVFFSGLAYRMMWFIFWIPELDCLSFSLFGKPGDSDTPTAWHFSLLKAYGEVDNDMGLREILSDGRGVLYRSDTPGRYVLWCEKESEFALPPGTIVNDILSNTETETDRLAVLPRQIYRIRTAGPSTRLSLQ